MIPKLIEIHDLKPFKGLIFDVSKIPVIRRYNKIPCDGQFNMLPEGKFFLHTSGSYWLKGKGPNKEGYKMLPPFERNPEEYGTKCFPWIARKKTSGEFVPLKLSKAGQGYVECRFTITIEDLERVGREDLIKVRRARPPGKNNDGYARNEGSRGLGMTINMHTLIGYALFPQYFQTSTAKYVMNHAAQPHDYRLSQLNLIKYENNYDSTNLKNREEIWLKDIFDRKCFSTGGIVGGGH